MEVKGNYIPQNRAILLQFLCGEHKNLGGLKDDLRKKFCECSEHGLSTLGRLRWSPTELSFFGHFGVT